MKMEKEELEQKIMRMEKMPVKYKAYDEIRVAGAVSFGAVAAMCLLGAPLYAIAAAAAVGAVEGVAYVGFACLRYNARIDGYKKELAKIIEGKEGEK
jgi:hypothetical protein